MKQKIRLIILGLVLSFLGMTFQSCDSDLDQSPSDKPNVDQVYKDFDAADAALAGTYKWFQIYTSHPLLLQLFIVPEMMGEDVYVTASGHYNRFIAEYQYTFTTTGSAALDPWRCAYSMIDNANGVIEGIAPLEDGARKKSILAQARTLRAYAYHMLVRLYAKAYGEDPDSPGVIIRLTPSLDPIPRSSVKEAYKVMIDDLIFATENLVESKEKAYIDLKAAEAMLARVYLDMGDDNAITYAERAAAGVQLLSTDEYATDVFDDINSETLWAFSTPKDYTMGYFSIPAFYYYIEGTRVNPETNKVETINMIDGYSTIRVSKNLINLFEDGDIRKKNFPINQTTGALVEMSGGSYLTSKFRHVGDAFAVAKTNLIRASEMYLIVAEIATDKKQYAKAKTALNTLRAARGLGDYKGTDADLEKEVMLERRRELYGEGHRLFDLKRRNQPLTRSAAQGHWSNIDLPARSPKMNLPIPQKEIDNNTALTKDDQNQY